MNKKIFCILSFILFFWFILNSLSAYSYVADTYNGRVKYGTYYCVKDGKTCNAERIESSFTMSGDACPPFVRNMPSEIHNEKVADFLTSKYCQFTPTTVKKYECRYPNGGATVYMKGGRAVSASYSSSLRGIGLQNLYKPDKCTEAKMEGDNGEPPLYRKNSQKTVTPNIHSNKNPSID